MASKNARRLKKRFLTVANNDLKVYNDIPDHLNTLENR